MNKSVVTKEKTELKDQLREQISLSWLASGRTKEHWRPWVLWALVGRIRESPPLLRRVTNP